MDKYQITRAAGEWRLERSDSQEIALVADSKTKILREMQKYMKTRAGSVLIREASVSPAVESIDHR